MELSYKLRKIRSSLMHRLIRVTPPKLKYFIAIDVVAYATTGKYGNTNVSELTAIEAIDRYGKDKGVE